LERVDRLRRYLW